MKVLYFTSTGNCLYVAKRFGGEVLSIPKLIKEGIYEIEDEVVGVVFPVYGLCIPPYVREYLEKVEFRCEYLFAIATYGFFSGAVCTQLEQMKLKKGQKINYINKLKMAENCITFADMKNQKGDSDKQQKAIADIIEDVAKRKEYVRSESFFHKYMTNGHEKKYGYPTGIGIVDKITVNESCRGCGTCVRVCPTANIALNNGKPEWGSLCVSCGACIQNCPSVAIHHEEEKNSERYRNPHVTVGELYCR